MLWNLARMCWSNLPRAFRSCGTLLFPALSHLLISLHHRSMGSTSFQPTLSLLLCSQPLIFLIPFMAPSSSLTGTLTQKSYILLNGLNFSYFLMCGRFPKRLVLICFPCAVLYELLHYASNTIFDPYPAFLPELKSPEDQWIGGPTGKCPVIWVFCLGCFSQCASWCLQSLLFQFAAFMEQCNRFWLI